MTDVPLRSVSVKLPEEMFYMLERVAMNKGLPRSVVIRSAIRKMIQNDRVG